jgi:putative NADPH-quinone reductase
MKTWIDMINAWAYKYESGTVAQPLHKIKQAIIIYSSMQDKKHLAQHTINPVEQQLTQTCTFIGIPRVDVYMVDKVTKMKPEDLIAHLEAVSKLCKTCT